MTPSPRGEGAQIRFRRRKNFRSHTSLWRWDCESRTATRIRIRCAQLAALGRCCASLRDCLSPHSPTANPPLKGRRRAIRLDGERIATAASGCGVRVTDYELRAHPREACSAKLRGCLCTPFACGELPLVQCTASTAPVSVGLAGQMQGAARRAWRGSRSNGVTPQMAGQGDARRERPTSASSALPRLPMAPPSPAQGALY